MFYGMTQKILFLLYVFSISLFIIFAIIPIDILKYEKKIKSITGYTGGIYYIHGYINLIANKYILIQLNLHQGTLIICIINYLIFLDFFYYYQK